MPLTSSELLKDPIQNFPQATVAAFDPTKGELPRRELDQDRTKKFVERLAELGVPGILIASSTGHGHLRTPEEMKQWIECVARANLRETVPMALLRPEDGTEVNDQLLDLLKQTGCPIVFFRPGTDLSSDASDDDLVNNLQPMIKAAAERDLAVGIYSIPDVSGMPLSAEISARLVEGQGGDHIVAAKITEANYETSTVQYLKHPQLKHLKIVQGWDPHLAQALKDGPPHDDRGRQRCGVTSGPMSMAVHQYLHIFEAAEMEDWDEVYLAQQGVTALFQSMQDDPTKFADLQRAKYIMGLGHPLISEVKPDQIERVFDALNSISRKEDQQRLARSLDLMGDGPYHEKLAALAGD